MTRFPVGRYAQIAILLGTLLFLLVWASYRETRPDWVRYRALSDPASQPKVVEIRIPRWSVVDRCPTCHQGIEDPGSSHPSEAFGCTICHGGQGRFLDKDLAHAGLLGGSNPSRLDVVDQTCGRTAPDGTACHGSSTELPRNQAFRVPRSLMATMTGVITSLRVTWNAQDTFEPLFASQTVGSADGLRTLFPVPFMSLKQVPKARDGRPLLTDRLGHPISISGKWADDQWRKFCARCHLWSTRESGPSTHLEGCAACHVKTSKDGRYHGKDVTLRDLPPVRGERHELTAAIEVDQCFRCHNRSSRIALNYQGWMESDGYGTPFRHGGFAPSPLSGERGIMHLAPDVHFEKGMHCIDCHTAVDTMGDGNLYGRMRDQVEISCPDCHGSADAEPRFQRIEHAEDYPVWASRSLRMPPNEPGHQVALTRRNGVLINVRKEKNEVALYSKVSGKRHLIRVITGEPGIHRIQGHGSSSMECYACHTRWAPQCYGCHDYYRPEGLHYDAQARAPSPGRWRETRDYYRFETPALGRNSRGRVAPFVPGCQVLFDALDGQGNPSPEGGRRVFHGKLYGHGIVSTPTFPHTVRRETASCVDCHTNPKRLGLGNGIGRRDRGNFERLGRPQAEGAPKEYVPEGLADSEGRPLQGTSHAGARPFTREELDRIFRVAACVVCHQSARDPIYENFDESLRQASKPEHARLEAAYFKDEVPMKFPAGDLSEAEWESHPTMSNP